MSQNIAKLIAESRHVCAIADTARIDALHELYQRIERKKIKPGTCKRKYMKPLTSVELAHNKVIDQVLAEICEFEPMADMPF
jgi:hypothetical protein